MAGWLVVDRVRSGASAAPEKGTTLPGSGGSGADVADCGGLRAESARRRRGSPQRRVDLSHGRVQKARGMWVKKNKVQFNNAI